jgi:hypothetical protein
MPLFIFLVVLGPVTQTSAHDLDSEFNQYALDLLQKSIKSVKTHRKGLADNNTKRYQKGVEMRLALAKAKKAVCLAKKNLIGSQATLAQLNEFETLSRNFLCV